LIALPTILAFAGLAFVMALSPGPNLLYLASRAICQGRGAGFASLAGVCTAMLSYMCATAAGLAALFVAVPFAYDALRLAGAAYLIFLAYKALRSPSQDLRPSQLAPEPVATLFWRGFLTCLFNPKIVLMYGALLPQFIEPNHGTVLAQTLQLGLLQVIAAASAHSCVILGAATASNLLQKRPGFARFQRYLLGAALIAVAARIGLSRRSLI
jgi:threonine/homoserine/homoserine lactone efflux protein